MCRKLQGSAAGTASWATNVGNERGEIVLTASEDVVSLKELADGLVRRYHKAGEAPPAVLYTDRDCCTENGPSKMQILFAGWPELHVRLDVWHFMRRLAQGVTTESHPLYGPFMAAISNCLFEWDEADNQALLTAKRQQLTHAGVLNPAESAVRKSVTREEAARHCRRHTRAVGETEKMLESLLLTFSSATDTLGVPLLKEEMTIIWEEQKRHIKCLQDPPGVSLYMVTGELKKGGVTLPIVCCARGSTSLESFHSHITRFIPGTEHYYTSYTF